MQLNAFVCRMLNQFDALLCFPIAPIDPINIKRWKESTGLGQLVGAVGRGRGISFRMTVSDL